MDGVVDHVHGISAGGRCVRGVGSGVVAALLMGLMTLVFGATPALGQIPDDEIETIERFLRGVIERPSQAQRLVRVWDFEDRATHREAIPADWYRAQHIAERSPFGLPGQPGRYRPGFPPWNEAAYSDQHSFSGDWSMALPTRGGSTALTLSRNALMVFGGSDYLVTVMVQTEALQHARARLVVRMLDANREPVANGTIYSDPVLSEKKWTRLSAYIDATSNAAWMQVELQLLQPSEWNSHGLDERAIELLPQDFRGAAYFDDLAVYQLPRVELAVVGDWPIARSVDSPELTIALRDHAGETLHANMQVVGVDGRLIDQTRIETPLDLTPVSWHPQLPGFGWYWVKATVHNDGDGDLVGFAETAFVWAPPGREIPTQSRLRFGVLIDHPTREVLDSTEAMVRASGAGSAMLAPWPDLSSAELWALGPTLAESEPFQNAIDGLNAMGVELTLALARVPGEIASQAGVDPLAVFQLLADTPSSSWLPALMPLLSTYGERIRRWQIGPTGDSAAINRDDFARAIDTMHSTLQRLIPRPIVVVPGRAEDDPTQPESQRSQLADRAAASMLLPYAVPEAMIDAHLASWSQWSQPSVVIEALPAELFGERAAVYALVRRAILAIEGGAERVMVEQPWHVHPRRRRGDLVLPRPELYAWRRLVDELSGRSPSVRLPMPPGVVATLFESQSDGTLIAWNSGADPRVAVIEGYLGDGPISVVDLWGNPIEEYEAGEPVQIQTTDMPVFIRGVDARIVKLRAGIDFSPRRLPSRGALIASELTLTNPFSEQLTGRLRIAEPAEWEMRPQLLEFAVEPGSTQVYPVELRFGAGELSGPRTLVLEVDAYADRRYPVLRVPIPVEIGLPNLLVLPMYRLVRAEGGRVDVIVEVMVTNTGTEAISSSLTMLIPGYPSERAPLSNMQPGQVVIRRFAFRGGGEALAGKVGMIMLREIDGNDRLNIELPFH